MRSLIISDLHSIDIKFMLNIIADARKNGIERLVCLGDFDDPRLLKNILDLEMKKIIVIGNHDVALTTEEDPHSPDVIDPEKYWDAWENSEREIRFVENARKYGFDKMHPEFGVRVVEKVQGKKICYVHGSIYGDDTCWGLSPYIRGRMLSRGEGHETVKEKRIGNFLEMQKQGYWILFRGHDHGLELLSRDKNPSITEVLPNAGEAVRLEPEKTYIATMGRLSEGGYATFDDTKRELWLGSYGR
jgi:predicted phosphodiesterase